MIVSEIKLFELLRARIGEKEAEAFVEILETRVDKKFEDTKIGLATKGDIISVKEEIAKLEVKISEKHNDLLKWMIIMWITQLGAIVAIIKLL